MTGSLANYEAMRLQVERCASIDEAAELRDQAAALSAYARQRDDAELQVWVQEIRLRASIRIGELVRDLETGTRQPAKLVPDVRKKFKLRAIAEAGLSTSTAYDYQQLAGPREENLQIAGRAAAEKYFAQARATTTPATQAGLREAVTAAVHAAMGPDAIRQAAKVIRLDEGREKQEQRAERDARLAAATARAAAKVGHRLYELIYADPPWRFETFSATTGMDRAADNHYPTMTTEDIAALAIPAAPCCGLFLWATAPMVFEAGDVLRAWGFSYSTQIIWNKDRIGLGYRTRNKHEILLIGTRGGFPRPERSLLRPSVIDAPVGRHSAKPDVFAAMLEEQYPALSKLEMFARTPRPGWDAWGNEAPDTQREAAHG